MLKLDQKAMKMNQRQVYLRVEILIKLQKINLADQGILGYQDGFRQKSWKRSPG